MIKKEIKKGSFAPGQALKVSPEHSSMTDLGFVDQSLRLAAPLSAPSVWKTHYLKKNEVVTFLYAAELDYDSDESLAAVVMTSGSRIGFLYFYELEEI